MLLSGRVSAAEWAGAAEGRVLLSGQVSAAEWASE